MAASVCRGSTGRRTAKEDGLLHTAKRWMVRESTNKKRNQAQERTLAAARRLRSPATTSAVTDEDTEGEASAAPAPGRSTPPPENREWMIPSDYDSE